ncbi:hypothetical protein H9639_15260 [Arthrobacter sp. Sa2CUA1]|uniref:Uncharacterized protein n=1 Tax=Arthrobacter gallicola TaxID=2762225 RepID=A0ABR8UVR4_9MICC|nr:hypothetical protein [Arthrobacter gallicola]MBD7996656.1 hypothetical protein [Arthrobacter gallicola]
MSSYTLKHTAEKFLRAQCSYVSNGRLIWAAAALGLPLVADGGLNLLIGISEQEHGYVRRIVISESQPKAHHYRPAGFTHLKTALEQCAAGELVVSRLQMPTPSTEVYPFHEWLIQPADRDDIVGDLAGDYFDGIESSSHRIAVNAQDLLDILREISAIPTAFDAALEAIVEWARTAPPELIGGHESPTEDMSSTEEAVPGWGVGAGTIERLEFLCPCGRGSMIEEHDNIPGFREHDVHIACGKCNQAWRGVPGLPIRGWRVEPKPTGAGG